MPKDDVTALLRRWSYGDAAALDFLAPLVYAELHLLAQAQLRQERGDHTLQSKALVNEAFLRLLEHPEVKWQNWAHFLPFAAR